ncbi:MAG: sensor histidine kinase [Cyclobacteriaceae bacterium]|nr:sensor histidine kinase [Cyclobacteriaceae bacterium]
MKLRDLFYCLVLVITCLGQSYGQVKITDPTVLYDNSKGLQYCLSKGAKSIQLDTSDFVSNVPSLTEKLNNIIWVKGSFTNVTQEKTVLGVLNATIDSLIVYIKENNSLRELAITGDRFPFYDRKYKTECFMVDMPASDSVQTFYLKIKVKELTEIPVFLGSQDAFKERFHTTDIGVAIFLGAILILIIYNLFICIATKELNYLIYAMANSFALLLILTLDGYSFHYFWPSSPALNDFVPSIAALNSALYCLFFISFTNLKTYEPKWRTYFVCVILFFVSLVPLNLFSYNYLAAYLYQVCAIPYIFIQLYVVRKVIQKGYTPARYFFWGSCLYSSGGLMFIMYNLNILPLDFPVGLYLKVSLLLEACLLSFALADKLNFLKNENIRITSESNSNLKVSNTKLKDALESLDLFTYRSAHDIRGPLMRLKGLINLLSTDQQYFDTYADKLKRTADNMEAILDKHIILNTLKNYKIRLSDVKAKKIIERIGVDLNLPLDSISFEEKEDITFYSDEYLLSLIFKEMISNSKLFAQENVPLRIKIRAAKERDKILFHYSDNGSGVEEASRGKIFEIFFRGSQVSQGSGIGLNIVSEAVSLLNGMIILKESKMGLTVFEIRIPYSVNISVGYASRGSVESTS